MEYVIEVWLHPLYANWLNDAEYCRVYHIADTELYKFFNGLYKAVNQQFVLYWQGDGAIITLPESIKSMPSFKF